MKEAGSLDVLLAALAPGPDPDTAAAAYRQLHARLTRLFTLNNVLDPGALADETLDRLAASLATRQVDSPAAFALGIARLLIKEEARRRGKEVAATRDWTASLAWPGDAAEKQARLDRLDRCLNQMEPERREMLQTYYAWPEGAKVEHHRTMAARIGLSSHALRNRLLRARAELAACMARAEQDVSSYSGTLLRVQEDPKGGK